MTEAADVVHMDDAHAGDRILLGLTDREAHGEICGDLPEAQLPAHCGAVVVLLDDDGSCRGFDLGVAQLAQVNRHVGDTVSLHAAEIGRRQVIGYLCRNVVLSADCDQHTVDVIFKLFVLDEHSYRC